MNKQKLVTEAIAQIPSGATIMVSGFGSPGTPFTLLDELVRQGQKDLTIIKNDANEDGIGVARLLDAGQVTRYITTHIGLNRKAIDLMNQGLLEVEFFPQGILAEKIRNGGSGCLGFLTDIGLDTELTRPEDIFEYQGQRVKIEAALTADFALIHATRGDHFGNLSYTQSAMNFCPIMAMAAEHTIAEVVSISEPGMLDPDTIHTPSAFVASVVELGELSNQYDFLEHRYEY